jgi:hypothetical protein
MQSSPASASSFLLSPNILLSSLLSVTPNLYSSLSVGDQVSYPYKTAGKFIVLYILICFSVSPSPAWLLRDCSLFILQNPFMSTFISVINYDCTLHSHD